MRRLVAGIGVLASGVAFRPVETLEAVAGQAPGSPGPSAAAVLIGLLAALVGGAAGFSRFGEGHGIGPAAVTFLVTGPVLVFGVFLAAAASIWAVTRLLGGRRGLGPFVTAWAGSYVPTAVWFAGRLIAHGLQEAPLLGDVVGRQGAGYPAFLIAFLVFSIAVWLWKSLLLYLTLRVVGELSFPRIALAAFILAPVALGYWVTGLHFGLFKVPFI